MLQITDLNVNLGKKQILKNVSLTIKPHSLTAIIGKNGSGKSTLVSAVNGTVPCTGQILFSGQDIRVLSRREKAKMIAVLPQTVASPHITVEQLVKMGRNPYIDIAHRFTQRDTQAVAQAFDAMDIANLKDCYLDCISGGERQKAYLAMILAQQTRLMLLDEPGTYMDMAYERQFMQTVCDLKRTMHKTVVTVMHNLNTAVRYADRIAVMDKGSIVFEGTRDECLESRIIEKTFGIDKYLFNNEVLFI